MTNERSPQY